MRESYPAAPVAAPLARHAVANYASAAGLDGEALDSVSLAVSEAVTNVIRHAYRRRSGVVEVAAGIVDNELWLLVADHGCGFRAPARDPGLGLGLALMADACADFVIAERASGGTEVRMHFPLTAGEASE